MQIFNDKKNKEFASYFQEILDADAYYKEIKGLALKLKGNTVELINLNYKKEVSVLVDFSKENNNFKDNNNFKKIFKRKGASILDCTAGLGRDSFTLASNGFNVTMIEKNPIIVLLLKNGLQRFIGKTKNQNKLSLLYGDSYDYLSLYNGRFDYIYIDFMFNKIKRKSLSSKNDETLKLLADDKENRFRLLEIARKKCKFKVIVKGSRNLSSIPSLNPNYSINTKLLRYDIFLGKDRLTIDRQHG